MNNKYLSTALISALFFSQAALAGDTCNKVGHVSGHIHTVNISDKIQSGAIKLKIKVDGQPYFYKRGTIIGRIVGQGIDSDSGAPFLLANHNMFLGWRTIVATSNDYALLTPTGFHNGAPCAFDVVEKMTSAVGSGKLKPISNNTHNVIAKGSISFCPFKNRNTFELSGTVCLD
jgi:hypothetical protein